MIIVMLSDDDVENSIVEELDNRLWELNNG
jgi:hypothetical protein